MVCSILAVGDDSKQIRLEGCLCCQYLKLGIDVNRVMSGNLDGGGRHGLVAGDTWVNQLVPAGRCEQTDQLVGTQSSTYVARIVNLEPRE